VTLAPFAARNSRALRYKRSNKDFMAMAACPGLRLLRVIAG
jgi:hypothetical protein